MAVLLLSSLAHAAPQLAPARLVGELVLDGVLDEAAWQAAEPVTDFVQYEPNQGQPSSAVEARLLLDDDTLYVGFVVRTDRDLVGPVVRRDETLFHDWVGVLLDTFADGQRAFAFRANPRGVQADGVFSDGSHIWMQPLAWDGVYRAEGHVSDAGYSVELAIPLRSLRYSADGGDWGLVLIHFQPQPWSIFTWPELSKDASGVLVQAASMHMDLPPPQRQLELLPTLTGFVDAEGATADPGLGAKVGLSSSLTLDLALNPDFSQIESDPQQVTANLKYPLQFSEKRPFFLESLDLFQTAIEVVHTRSVVNPLLGYKLTGRASALGVGLLGALDQSPAPSTIAYDFARGEALPTWDDDTVAGTQALVHVMRLRQDLGGGASVGTLWADKELLGTGLANRVGGLDVLVPMGRFKLGAQAALSQTDTPEGLLVGPAWNLQLDRSGERFEATLFHSLLSESFRAETGFLEEVGRAEQGGRLGLRFNDVGPLRFVGPALFGDVSVDRDGQVVGYELGPKVEALFGEGGYANVNVTANGERFRGQDFQLWASEGYVGFSPTSWSGLGGWWWVGTSPLYDFDVDPDAIFAGFAASVGPEASVTIAYRIQVSTTGSINRFYGPDGSVIYDTVLVRPEVSVNLTRELSLRLIEDWSSYERVLASSALLAWQRNHGTAVYLGYAGESVERTAEHTVFAKVSLLWRP